jgi:hypothetical protein
MPKPTQAQQHGHDEAVSSTERRRLSADLVIEVLARAPLHQPVERG